MVETGKELGKLSLAIIEDFVESKLDKEFVTELRVPTDEQPVIVGAMQITAERLWKERMDEHLWNAIFNHLPKKKKLLTALKQAVKTFYYHPADMGFCRGANKNPARASGIFARNHPEGRGGYHNNPDRLTTPG